jgi:hypothetical protein
MALLPAAGAGRIVASLTRTVLQSFGILMTDIAHTASAAIAITAVVERLCASALPVSSSVAPPPDTVVAGAPPPPATAIISG